MKPIRLPALPSTRTMKRVLAALLFLLFLLGGIAAIPRADLLHAVGTAKDFVDSLVDGIRPAMEQVAGRAERMFDEDLDRDRTERTMPKVHRPGGISGSARVIDGDTLMVGSKRVRLFGIDAPELDQRCRAAGRSWPCGREATRALAGRIDGLPIACDERTRDDYGRSVAVCRRGGADLNRWMVAQGWALAYRRYSQDYVSAERTAKSSRRGMWRGEFVPPWEWRRG